MVCPDSGFWCMVAELFPRSSLGAMLVFGGVCARGVPSLFLPWRPLVLTLLHSPMELNQTLDVWPPEAASATVELLP